MKSKFSDAQAHALAVLFNRDIECGFEFLDGVRGNTLESLAGFVYTKGARKHVWSITDDGKLAVRDLMSEGRIVREATRR